MTKVQQKVVPQAQKPQAASVEEVNHAIAALTDEQAVKLRVISNHRHRSLGKRGAGRDPNHLLLDAINALLEGKRHWYPASCDLVRFLDQAMRSIADHLRTAKRHVGDDALDRAVPPPAELTFDELAEATPAGTPNPQQQLEAEEHETLARQMYERFRAAFDEDFVGQLVYEALADSRTPGEIRESLGLSMKEYETVVKRVRRTVTRLMDGGSR